MDKNIKLSVFTKLWKQSTINELAKTVSGLGFDGIEFPLRDGYQLELKNAEKGLLKLVKIMEDYGLEVTSIASTTDENVFAGCAAAGIPVIRTMCNIDIEQGYMTSEKKIKKKLEQILPLCEKYGVKVGVQHHFGYMINNSMELYNVVKSFNPEYIAAIWDSAHSALAGEEPEQGLDILWPNLCMINLKNAYYRRKTGTEAEDVQWERYFTTGSQGLSSWPRVIEYLLGKKYEGVICLSAEYTDEKHIDRLAAQDIAFLESLLYR